MTLREKINEQFNTALKSQNKTFQKEIFSNENCPKIQSGIMSNFTCPQIQ